MIEERTGRGAEVLSIPDRGDENTHEIRRVVQILFAPGAVVELRALDGNRTISGYFMDHEELARQAALLDRRGYRVYVTLNPVEPALLARAENRVKQYPKATTADANVLRRRWLPIDLDPVRPSGVSATEEEKRAALSRAAEIRGFLRERGWPDPVEGDSGNGAHLLYLLDLPNDRANLDLVKSVLDALHFKFSDRAVIVDTSTANASRIWKLYGTTARKGDSTHDRPHRRSRLLRVPESLDVIEEGAAACR